MPHKITIVLRRRHHCEHARAVLQKHGMHYPVYELTDEMLSSGVQQLVSDGAQVLVTGDLYANLLMGRVNIPISPIRRSKMPFSVTIREALLHAERIAFVWREKDRETASKACAEFGKSVTLFTYREAEDLELTLDDVVRQGFRVVVGLYVIKEPAERHGLVVFNIPYDDDDILSAIRNAEHNLRAIEERMQYTEMLNIIQNNISEGILALGPGGEILMLNQVAEHILRIERQDWLGMPLDRTTLSCPETADLLQRFEPFSNKIMQLHGVTVAMEGRPVFVHRLFRAAILTLTPVEQLQRSEQAIRAKMNAHGFVATTTFADIVGKSPALLSAIQVAERYARVDSSILVCGESGTGKEMFVQSIHNASRRRGEPFVVINCAALPENLIESELFGYERGAFTGALSNGKQGLFERGHKGTVFLDEISEMPLHVQARFLRVLQEKEVTPIGGQRVIPVDIRVIAASNRDLLEMVEQKRFREDLYYRISVLMLDIPPLWEREGDLDLLVRHFARVKSEALNIPIQDVSQEAVDYLRTLRFPGNIRQLSNIVERAIVLCKGHVLDLEAMAGATTRPSLSARAAEQENPETSINALRAETIRKYLTMHGGSRAKTAKALGISTSTLYRRMKELGISLGAVE